MILSEETTYRYQKLTEILAEMGSVMVAFSGGVDSSLLLKVAAQVLGERAVAATARSETYPESEVQFAQQLAATLNVKHLLLSTHELESETFAGNPPDRCYHCKSELFDRLGALAQANGCAYVADGANADDLNDFRPGRRAAKERAVRSPLQEAGLTKANIRELARYLGLPNWDKPAMACLSSRFPYGQQITLSKLRQVEEAENVLHVYGIQQCRARHYGATVRIEVGDTDFSVVVAHRGEITMQLRALGFTYVTLDLAGYRTGSMNEVLGENTRLQALA